MAENKELSSEEIALYDRQIRLWGLDAQRRIKTANILLINLSAVGTEIAKNLVLGGIGSLSIIDSHDITENDFAAQFYISEEDLGKNRAVSAQERIQDLNPRVKLQIFTDDFNNKDEDWFKQFNLIISTEASQEQNLKLNHISRKFKVPFYATGLNGLFGYIFVDLIDHVATYKKQKSNIATKPGKLFSFSEVVDVKDSVENGETFESITTREYFKSFKDFLQSLKTKNDHIAKTYTTKRKLRRITPVLPLTLASLPYLHTGSTAEAAELTTEATQICETLSLPTSILEDKDELIKSFAAQLANEFAPTSAIIGGAVAQDIINALGKKGRPLNNFIVLDGISGEMPIFTI